MLKYESSVLKKMDCKLFRIESLPKSILIYHYQSDPLGSCKQQSMLIVWIKDQLVLCILNGGHPCWWPLSSIEPCPISTRVPSPQNPPAGAPGLVPLVIIKPIRIENIPYVNKHVMGLANEEDSWQNEKHWGYSGVYITTSVTTFLSSPSGTQSLNEAHTEVQRKMERINTLRTRRNGRRSTDDIFKSIFLTENV